MKKIKTSAVQEQIPEKANKLYQKQKKTTKPNRYNESYQIIFNS